MGFSMKKKTQIRNLMFLTALLVLVIVYGSQIYEGIRFFRNHKLFVYGGTIAFVLNIPLRTY